MRIEGFMAFCPKILRSFLSSCFYAFLTIYDTKFSHCVMPFYLGFLFLPAHACIGIGRETVQFL